MNITSILSPELTFCKVQGAGKERLFEVSAELIASKVPNISAAQINAGLAARERLGSTGLGDGIAIPHCRVPGIQKTLGCLVTLAEPVAFDAIDNKPVDLLFFLLVPADARAVHLDTLRVLAEHLSKPEFCKRLRAAGTDAELYAAATSA